MGKHHEPFQALGPVEWQNVPQDGLDQFVSDIVSETQTVIESVPAPSTKATPVGRARSKTESAVDSSEVQRAFAQRQQGASVDLSEDLRKEWKEIKVGPKENPLGINVYKLGSKDGRGAWFARRSIHEGLSFDKWKQGLEREFGETMKVQGSPGSGNIRGIGADKRVESRDIDENGKLQVYQLSAQFPGPTSPRDFVTLLLTSESSAKPADGSRPLRQFMIISKPCEHPECPPRQGIIRGYYESVELVREVPLDNLGHKRSLSSADLGKDEARARSSTGPSSDTRSEKEDIAPMAIEWLMVTRSDPGGSVPRFLIEKGTPPGICGDAGKFMKWVTTKAAQGFPPINEDGIPEEVEEPSDVKGEETANAQNPPANHVNRVVTHQYQEEEPVPSSSGLYGILAGAIGAASSYVPASFLRSWASNSDAGSTEENSSGVPPIKDTYATVDSSSDSSSIRSFASALERSVTAQEEKSPESVAESQSETSRSVQTQNDKDLKKLQERRRKLDEKVAKLEKRRTEKLEGGKEKDAATMAKLREKHDREVAKKEEKYKRELRKLEEKREAEQRKAEERRRKAAEKEDRANMAIELEKMKAERDLARKEVELLEMQVGELQSQNTMLARKLGKLGLIEESDSTPSLSSLSKPETVTKGSPLVS